MIRPIRMPPPSGTKLVTSSAFRQHQPVADDISVPLCVDLDGTLLNTDMLWESLKDVSRKKPWCMLLVPFWFLQGRAHLKQKVAALAHVDITTLPFHHGLVEFLKQEKTRGRKLILATASDQSIADKIAARFGLFDEVLASNGQRNLRGTAKAALLIERFGKRRFDYAGNSPVDLQVWSETRCAIVVNGSDDLVAKARAVTEVAHVFPEEPGNPCRTPW